MKQLIYNIITGVSIAAIAICLALQADFNKTLVKEVSNAQESSMEARLEAHKAMVKDSILHEHFSQCAFVSRKDVQFISVGHKSGSCNCR